MHLWKLFGYFIFNMCTNEIKKVLAYTYILIIMYTVFYTGWFQFRNENERRFINLAILLVPKIENLIKLFLLV